MRSRIIFTNLKMFIRPQLKKTMKKLANFIMKKQIEDQKDEIDIKRNEIENVISAEELGLNGLDSQMLNCNHCENTFLNKKDLKKHVKDKHVAQARNNLITLERKSQTKTLATSNFELIQIEIAEKHNPCKCRYSFCRIIQSIIGASPCY